MSFVKNIIRFIFRKRIAELKAKQFANNMIDSIKTVTSGDNGPGVKSTLENMKKTGIKKVELICANKCPCCKKLLNKKISIENAVELPMEGCELVKCYGRYCAVVEF